MISCPRCQRKNSAWQQFCSHCGARISSPPKGKEESPAVGESAESAEAEGFLPTPRLNPFGQRLELVQRGLSQLTPLARATPASETLDLELDNEDGTIIDDGELGDGSHEPFSSDETNELTEAAFDERALTHIEEQDFGSLDIPAPTVSHERGALLRPLQDSASREAPRPEAAMDLDEPEFFEEVFSPLVIPPLDEATETESIGDRERSIEDRERSIGDKESKRRSAREQPAPPPLPRAPSAGEAPSLGRQHWGLYPLPGGPLIPLQGRLKVGKSLLSEPAAGCDEEHALLEVLPDGGLRAQDLGSARGTWRGLSPAQLERLHPGDEFRVGRLHFRLAQRSAPPQSTSASPSWSRYSLLLLHEQGEELGRYPLLPGGNRIGRRFAELCFPQEKSLNPSHCVVFISEDEISLRDYESQNGTWIRLRGPHLFQGPGLLRTGDQLWRLQRSRAR